VRRSDDGSKDEDPSLSALVSGGVALDRFGMTGLRHGPTTMQEPPDSTFAFAAMMLFFSLQMIGTGLLWGISGFVAFRLARVRDRLWPVGALLTGLTATTVEWLGFYVTSLLMRRLEVTEVDQLTAAGAAMHVVTAAMAAFGFVIAWMVLRRRLFVMPATSS